MDSPSPDVPLAARRTNARPLLTWLMVVFAVPVPLGIVLALLPQLTEIGEVSHWPWEEYGVLGWWLVPLSLAVAAVCGAARPDRGRSKVVWLLSALAVLTTAALFYNP
ncbi:hypothetical protein [uncultured Georgenia sp.]|uniref:hypothetical protein n=1 Tax=uncultured Georgenia sp. TaxID=378209 RepID=UPI002628D7FB|nr:hypothetical protein [uncultured Georgenia sp.]HLV05446.1 hypothetical protein [Actinomycetaceae bacterium]